MTNGDEVKLRLEKLKNYMYQEINSLMTDTCKKETKKSEDLSRFMPDKHRKAYRLEKNFKKRNYNR